MKKFIQITIRILVTPCVFFLFGVTGLLKLWKYGGGIHVNYRREVNEAEAVAVINNVIAEYNKTKEA